jgi:hypothetical protein
MSTTIVEVDRKNVRDRYLFDIIFSSVGSIFGRDVFGELAFCICSFARKASRGDMLCPVENDPS